MKLLFTTVLTLLSMCQIFAQQAIYDVSAGNGNGIRFWSSDYYKIHMGNTAEYQYGPVTDYSIKMNMSSNPGRGWTWGPVSATPIAALSNVGHMQIAGNFTSMANGVFNGRLKVGSPGVQAGTPALEVNNTFANHTDDFSQNRPFVIRRGASDNEAFFNFLQDVHLNFVYQNDENYSRIHYRIINTDTETGGGANANSHVVMTLFGNPSGSGVSIGTNEYSGAYKLSVGGVIRASEVKVQNVPSSDYVFEPDYPLLPLSEVETHIKEKRHLPGIPSAEEFKQNGVGLGEMDDMLLRKVEELTLYVIELKKENEELKMANNILVENNEEFKKMINENIKEIKSKIK